MEIVKRKKKLVLIVSYKDKPGFKELQQFKKSGGIGIVHASTGHDNVASVYCKDLGLEQVWLEGYSTQSVVEFGLLLLLKASREQNVLSNNNFTYKYVYKTGSELKDKFVLIIGSLGRIGSGLKEILQTLGMLVLEYDSKPGRGYIEGRLFRDLGRADFIFLCVNAEGNTRFFTEKYFRACKKSPVLINLVRKSLVGDRLLIEALNQKWISGYYVDDVMGNSFKDSFSVHATGHRGASTIEARKRQKAGVTNLVDEMFEEN